MLGISITKPSIHANVKGKKGSTYTHVMILAKTKVKYWMFVFIKYIDSYRTREHRNKIIHAIFEIIVLLILKERRHDFTQNFLKYSMRTKTIIEDVGSI